MKGHVVDFAVFGRGVGSALSAVCSTLALLLLFVSPAWSQQASPQTMEPQLRTQLWNLINNGSTSRTQEAGKLAESPSYRGWNLFPPTATSGSYANRRLGLPVHGRWVTTYVNGTAFDCIKAGTGCAADPAPQKKRLPPGSIIVKENYPNKHPSSKVAQAATPGVITVMWKPFEGYCGTELPYNGPRRATAEGKDCFGGEWLYAFYILQNPVLKNPQMVQKYDSFVTSTNNSQNFCINCHAPAFEADYLRGLLGQWREPIKASGSEKPPQVNGKPSDFCDDIANAELSSTVPADVPLDPLSLAGRDKRQRMFDCHSWRLFIALNWPGSWADRGKPSTQQSFGDYTNPAGGPPLPAVWQTYRATWEVFQPDQGGAWHPPTEFNGPRPAPKGQSCPDDGSGYPTVKRTVLTQIAKSRVGNLGVGDLGNEIGQAFAGQFGTVADQNGVLARYEVSMNEAEFNYLIENGFAENSNLTPSGPRGTTASFPAGSIAGQEGAIEVKAGWKRLCTDPNPSVCPLRDDPSRYFAREVWVYDEVTQKCDPEPVLMGLIGIHIIHKTHWAPQWIWSTFEQIDNVPPLVGDQVNGSIEPVSPRFYDGTCQPDETYCFWRPFLVGKKFDEKFDHNFNRNHGNPCCPNVTLNRFKPFGFFQGNGKPVPNQVTRLAPIAGSGLNEILQKRFATDYADTPFKYYVLVNTQWPLNGRDPENGQVNTSRCAYAAGDGLTLETKGANCFTLVPEFLRNSVIESYMADYYNDPSGQPVQATNRSCMGCHADAGADFSYIFLDAVEQRVPLQASGLTAGEAKTRTSPSMASHAKKLYMVWQGLDRLIHWAVSDGNTWDVRGPIEVTNGHLGSSKSPALFSHDGTLYMLYKGPSPNDGAYWAKLDDSTGKWADLKKIILQPSPPGGRAKVIDSFGLASLGGSFYMVYQGEKPENDIYWAVLNDKGQWVDRLRVAE